MAQTSSLASASPISVDVFDVMASRCARSVAAGLLESVAQTESAMDPWVLHDDTTGIIDHPESLEVAMAEATTMHIRGDSFDIGLMQINSANLSALRMTISSALDPCASMAGGAAILQAAYGSGGTTTAEQQVALLMALSRYNTGSPFRGIMNGYARNVEGNGNKPGFNPSIAQSDQSLSNEPRAPPSWDVSATGTYVQLHGAPWLVGFATMAPSPDIQGQTVTARPVDNAAALHQRLSSTQLIARSK